MFSSVIPGEYMSGHLSGQIQFPSWFGKYSKQNKFNRILQELQSHTRLRCGGRPKLAFSLMFFFSKKIPTVPALPNAP